MTQPAVVVDHVSKQFRLYRERNASLKVALMRGGRARYDEFQALDDVSFEIPTGATFGLMGVNGSGKSTLLKCIANILRPDSGRVLTAGKVAALLELGSGFHQELSGRENVYLNGSILGLSKKELDDRFDEIVDFAGVHQFIDQPVKNYSSGMYVRLGFSVAINVDPDVLLVDEVLAVGDQAFQDKCMAKFVDFKRRGKTVVIVSHALGSLRQMCDEVAWLSAGRLVEIGEPAGIIDSYVDQAHQEPEATTAGVGWGSGEVVIEDVVLLDARQRPTTLVHTGEQVTVRVGYRATSVVDAPVFALAVQTIEGVDVWGQTTRDAEIILPAVHGPGFVEFAVGALPLLTGSFDVNVTISDESLTHVYDFRRHACPFQVGGGGGHGSLGLVDVRGHWSLHAVGRVGAGSGGDGIAARSAT